MSDDLILTVAEAARLLRVGKSTLRDHIRSGEIPHLRLGRRILLRRDSLLEWVRRSERGPAWLGGEDAGDGGPAA